MLYHYELYKCRAERHEMLSRAPKDLCLPIEMFEVLSNYFLSSMDGLPMCTLSYSVVSETLSFLLP